jgi:hypothetical protein
MQTRSQTAAAAIAVNAMTFMDNINEDVTRKTRLIRRSNLLPKQTTKNTLPQNPFTILTRSKTRELQMQRMNYFREELMKKPKYDIDIDFDAASKAWNRNKKRIGNGCYIYK